MSKIGSATKSALQSLCYFCLVAAMASPAALASESKPILKGLISCGSTEFNRNEAGDPDNSIADVPKFEGVLTGVVLNFSWAQLQPKPDSFEFPVIQSAMTPVLQFNRRHPRFALRAEIRVWSGREAPDWVKELGGGPVTVAHGKNKVQIPRFWTAEYRHAWSKLQDQLAGQFDAQPEVASVTNTLGASISDDPFLLPTDAVSIKNLRAAGFTDAAYEACLSGAAEACKSWKHTAVIYPFNTFISIGGGRAKSKPDVAPRIMRKFRQDFGTRAVLSNQSLQASPPIEVKRLYAEMKRLGAPIQLQVCVPDEHQWEAAIKYGASIGATTIELHPRSGPANNQHGFSVMKREELLKLDRVLFGN